MRVHTDKGPGRPLISGMGRVPSSHHRSHGERVQSGQVGSAGRIRETITQEAEDDGALHWQTAAAASRHAKIRMRRRQKGDYISKTRSSAALPIGVHQADRPAGSRKRGNPDAGGLPCTGVEVRTSTTSLPRPWTPPRSR